MNHLLQTINDDEYKSNNLNFDYEFYINLYPDVIQSGFKDYDKALGHWNNFGKFEGRVCNNDMLLLKLKTSLKNTIEKIGNTNITLPNHNNYLINILVRTHSRPELFSSCINSIYQQNLDCKIISSFDNTEDLNYLVNYPEIEAIYLSISNTHKYKFNLYCNHLMEHVQDGWIFFLDDDDMFLHPNSLKIILQNIETEFDLIIWKFLRPDGEIYPKNIDNIKLGEICSCNFCFHSRFKNLASWQSRKCGDYYFFSELISRFNFNIKLIPISLTSNIEVNKIGNFGR